MDSKVSYLYAFLIKYRLEMYGRYCFRLSIYYRLHSPMRYITMIVKPKSRVTFEYFALYLGSF